MSTPVHPLNDPAVVTKRMQIAQPNSADQWAAFIEMILQFAGQIVPIIVDIINAAGAVAMSVFVPGTGSSSSPSSTPTS